MVSYSMAIARAVLPATAFFACWRLLPFPAAVHWGNAWSRYLGWLLLAGLGVGGGGERWRAAEPYFEEQSLFTENTDGFRLYRIPGVIVSAGGTVLAYAEARKFTVADRGEIEVHVRRSIDGGHTFLPAQAIAHRGPRLPRNPHLPDHKKRKKMGGPNEQTVNNPVAIADRRGPIHFLYCVEYMRCFYMRSEDEGETWSFPREITSSFAPFRSRLDWQAIATGPGHGIQLRQGRLVVPVWLATYAEEGSLRKASATIYSDDGGETWQAGELAIPGGGEANVVQLSDDRVWLTARNADPRGRRQATTSPDGADGWSSPRLVEELLEPGCMAGIVAHPGRHPLFVGPLLLYSHPYTTDRPHQARRDVTIQASLDDGRSWAIRRTLHVGPSAYSDLAVLADGDILCFYESGSAEPDPALKRPWAYSSLTMARFNLAWLAAGYSSTPLRPEPRGVPLDTNTSR
jgi:sialidase-1